MRSIASAAALALIWAAVGSATPGIQALREHPIEVAAPSEAVVTITAGCKGCDWGASGREAAALRLTVNGRYSQHLLLSRGERPMAYTVLLGHLPRGTHRLAIERDERVSATYAGEVTLEGVSVRLHGLDSVEHKWLSHAPLLHARPGTVERFSDVPLLMYVEQVPGHGSRYAYTVIFSHEDGGTPTDRLMATWGRSTDIEYIHGVTLAGNEARDEDFQGRDHAILPFRGVRSGSHPLFWVSTENNMVSDNGPPDALRFAPAPQLVDLTDVSREKIMDDNPWLYAVTAAELVREGRVDPDARPGSGKVADPRRFAVIEACGTLQDATLAFDVAISAADGDVAWHASDDGDARFRIARSGCFRSAVRLPANASARGIKGVRARAYTRPARNGEAPLPAGHGRVELERLNTVFMLDADFTPVASNLKWAGSLVMKGESAARVISQR
jgi:hypothetical protein